MFVVKVDFVIKSNMICDMLMRQIGTKIKSEDKNKIFKQLTTDQKTLIEFIKHELKTFGFCGAPEEIFYEPEPINNTNDSYQSWLIRVADRVYQLMPETFPEKLGNKTLSLGRANYQI